MSANDPRYARLERRLERSVQDLPLRVLQTLVDRPGTARQLGHVLNEEPYDVLAHLVDLWEDGCIELAPGLQADDPLDHRYQILTCFFDDSEWAELPRSAREALSATELQILFTEVVVALKRGSFERRTDRHLTSMRLQLDESGWQELTTLLRRTSSEVEAVKDRSRARLASSGGEVVDVAAALLAFERGRPASA